MRLIRNKLSLLLSLFNVFLPANLRYKQDKLRFLHNKALEMLNSIRGSFTVVSDRQGVTGDGYFIFKSLAEALAQKTLKVRA